MEVPTKPLVLDHVAKLEIPAKKVPFCSNELRCLDQLGVGLAFLYDQVRLVERRVIEEWVAEHGEDVKGFSYGRCKYITSETQHLVLCAFHWYSVSVCNFVQLVGTLAEQTGHQLTANEYVKEVVPRVVIWRHKIGAHYSATRKKDVAAVQAMSIMDQASFVGRKRRFVVGNMQLTVKQEGKTTSSKAVKSWSLTELHERLRERYWPAGSDPTRSPGATLPAA